MVNGTGRAGLAATNAAALSQLGFHVQAPANGASQTATAITYPAGDEAQAKAVAAHVPGATVMASTAVRLVTLTLGGEGSQVGSTASTTTSSPTAPSKATRFKAARFKAARPSASPSSAGPAQAFNASSCIN